MVHRREVDGQALVFGNQGDLWKRAMTWFDHETGSVWSQPTGEAILGPLTGNELELLPSALATWGAWKERFPETLALDVRTVGSDFSLSQMVLVAVVGDDSAGVSFSDLRRTGVYEGEVGDEPVAYVADVDRWAVYSRIVAGEVRSFELVGVNLVDVETGEQWAADTGASLDGGEVLDRVPSLSSFPDDYEVHFPNGSIIDLG